MIPRHVSLVGRALAIWLALLILVALVGSDDEIHSNAQAPGAVFPTAARKMWAPLVFGW